MFRRRAPRHGFTTTVSSPRPAAGHRSDPEPAPAVPGGPGAGAAGRDPGGPPPPGLDVSTAHPARVWNYWLGGRDYFAADRAAGEQLDQEFPHLAQTARAERAFLVRAVRFLAGPAKIRQFLDVGAGLPAGGNTHEIAQRISADAGIVYLDNDPAVLVHARALLQAPMLASTPEGTVSYVEADLRDVNAVLAGSAGTLDLERPVALMMLGVLGHIGDHGAARSITSQLMEALPSGSYLAIADGVAGNERVDSAQQRYNDAAPVPYHLQRPDELASFFDGLDLVDPGVVPCPRWKPDASGDASSADEEAAYCGVARKR
jgi:O-methyltransferase involved in polyketide biosynthesis